MNRTCYHGPGSGRRTRLTRALIRSIMRATNARRLLSHKAIAARTGLSTATVARIARGELPKFVRP